MKNIFILFFLATFIFACQDTEKKETNNENAQAEPEVVNHDGVSITPIEHATAVVQYGEFTIYIDPTGGASAFEGFPAPDLVLITDIHGDHLSIETLDSLDLSKSLVIVPQAVANELSSEYFSKVLVMANGDVKEKGKVTIEAVPMYNLREEALDFHPKGRGNGYILSMGDERIYFSGDTEDTPEMRALENIDKAFVCMNLPYTMSVESAASGVLAFKPKQVYPYHYRGKPDVGDVKKFKQLVNEGDPTIEVVQWDWYPEMDY